MKRMISTRWVPLYPAALASVLVLATYLPHSWSQSSSYPGAYTGGANSIGNGGGVFVSGPSHSAASQSHLMSSATLSNGAQQIVLVDPARMTMVVYHVEAGKGDIQLKSVRKIDADFALEEFNLTEPTPSTIRKNLRIPER